MLQCIIRLRICLAVWAACDSIVSGNRMGDRLCFLLREQIELSRLQCRTSYPLNFSERLWHNQIHHPRCKTMSNAFEIFLGRLCPLILDFDSDPTLVESFSKLFRTEKQTIDQFLNEAQAIFVEYEKDPTPATSSPFTFSLKPIPAAGRRVVSLSLVKCTPVPIDCDRSIASQVRVIKLHNNHNQASLNSTTTSPSSETNEEKQSEGTNSTTEGAAHGLQALYDFVHYTFGPLVRSVADGKVDGGNGGEGTATTNGTGSSSSTNNNNNKTLPAVAKSLKEFEYALKNCMQHTEIPKVHFQLEPEIQTAVVTCETATEGKDTDAAKAERPSLEDLGFGAGMEDSNVLSRLANSVKRWTVDIQKVTSLDRDIHNGAAVQEINFWRNMETTLENVENQVQSLGVTLSVEILNREKQFYVTIPFRQDTGLSKAKKKVEGYMQLLRDFPINAILTSSDVKQMTEAVLSIFNHLRRMKSAQYPVERAFRLLEAISRDLSHQIIEGNAATCFFFILLFFFFILGGGHWWTLVVFGF